MKFLDRTHYQKSTLFLGLSVLVLVLGFAAGWATAEVRKVQRDDAKQGEAVAKVNEAQAQTNVEAASDYLKQFCKSGVKSACNMVRGIQSADNVSEIQDSEFQDPEIQDPEIQESEQQEAEQQEADTFCRDRPELCQGAPGSDGTNGAPGSNGTDGANGSDGRSVTAVTCNDSQNFVVAFSDGTSDILLASDCQAQDGAQGAQGAQGDTGAQGEPGTATPGDYDCESGSYVRGFTVLPDGGVLLHCEPLLLP